jgi:hypothetical protein
VRYFICEASLCLEASLAIDVRVRTPRNVAGKGIDRLC